MLCCFFLFWRDDACLGLTLFKLAFSPQDTTALNVKTDEWTDLIFSNVHFSCWQRWGKVPAEHCSIPKLDCCTTSRSLFNKEKHQAWHCAASPLSPSFPSYDETIFFWRELYHFTDMRMEDAHRPLCASISAVDTLLLLSSKKHANKKTFRGHPSSA